MLIRELRKHFPARMPEWINSGIMVSWGAYVLLHPDTYADAKLDLFEGVLHSPDGINGFAFWGLVTLIVGMVRGCALFVNGAYSRTPMIRLAASAVSAFVWSQIVIGFWNLNIPTTAIVTYGWLVLMDIISAYRAGVDVAIAEIQRRNTVSTGTYGRDYSNSFANSGQC